ncbi:restriction endonuclease subunit S [uncultured Polaribacter sp.]|uniref:restriction endonuclease subunit S n=1 Tax=uncultured Polaribacter sp. TaxID=174711 RepID=UPI002618FDC4|nr:restriction endonuclease subunit S [uncultured Polaribacter sp.]
MAKEYLIGDFLKRIKRPIDLEPNQNYNLVTIKMNHKGVILRGQKKGCDIKSKMFEVKEGDFILSGIDARNGAFGIVSEELEGAIVTNDFWYFEIDEKIISKQLFLELTATTWFDDICQKGSDGTTQRIRLQKNKFFNQKIFLPEGDEQKELLNKILTFKKGQTKLNKEIDSQKHLLTQLKQSILQEAIQGKLTKDWREQNPDAESASELLKRIKAEKAQLIKDKKIKKEKPLPKITKEEVPFELPEGWVWSRLGEVIVNSDNLNIHNILPPNELVNYVDIDTIDNKHQKIKEPKLLPVNQLSTRARRVLKKGNIMYSLVRPYLHNLAIIKDDKKNYIGSTGFAVFNCLSIENKFVFWLLLSKYIENIYLEFMDGFNSPSITHDQFKSTIIPIPPFSEQKEIVKKVDSLMQQCQALEQEIKTSETNAQMLMQAVLKEAFESKENKPLKM